MSMRRISGPNLVSATHRILDHHHHHGWQWLAAINPHKLHHLLMVNKIIIYSKFKANPYWEMYILILCWISSNNRKTPSQCYLAHLSKKMQRNFHKQQFESKMTISAVITWWESLTKCQTITFLTNSSNYPLTSSQIAAAMTTLWLHQLPMEDVDKDIIIHLKFWANHYTKSMPWISVTFPEAIRSLGCDVSSHSTDIAPVFFTEHSTRFNPIS